MEVKTIDAIPSSGHPYKITSLHIIICVSCATCLLDAHFWVAMGIYWDNNFTWLTVAFPKELLHATFYESGSAVLLCGLAK